MERIAQQLLDLLWGALPTAVIVFLFFFFLRWAFWRPLERVLAQRQAATEGARREADQLLSQVDEKLRQYEEALRQARGEVYHQQEAARQQALDERNRILRETREKAMIPLAAPSRATISSSAAAAAPAPTRAAERRRFPSTTSTNARRSWSRARHVG